jgi:uncharacterized delta-60 repeat protein
MKRKTGGVLLGALALAGCSDADETSQARRPPARDVVTAPAGGLWSHRFVRWPDGKVTAVGFSRKPAGIGLVRYLPSGAVDSSFKRIVHPQFGAGKLDALAAAPDSRGNLLVAGCQPPDCWGYFVLGRIRPDGSLDPAFGNGGLVRTSVAGGALEPRALALQRDGKMVVAGELSVSATRQAFLARFLPSGRADRSFGGDGLVLSNLPTFTALAMGRNGEIIAAGHQLNPLTRPASSSVSVARYLANGQVDRDFGTGGAAHDAAVRNARALLIRRDGTIVVAGSGASARRAFAITRFTAKGTLDRTFGRRGRMLHSRPGDQAATAEALTPLPGGLLVATGWATRGRSVLKRRYHIVVLALRPSGALAYRRTVQGTEARGEAAFRATPRRLLVVGANDDLEPLHVVFATIRLPR